MLNWAFSFLILALVAAFLGFGGLAMVSVEIARLIFFIFITLFIVACIMQVLRGKTPSI
jgi:uncharacterized membrane protein YtjA (UPF0391 family)